MVSSNLSRVHSSNAVSSAWTNRALVKNFLSEAGRSGLVLR